VKYDAATVALRVLRLVGVASIFAFALTARTVTPAHASTQDATTDPPPAVVDVSPTEPPPTEPPPTEPPPTEPPPPDPSLSDPTLSDPTLFEPAPTESEPPPADPINEAPTDPLPTDTASIDESPTEPPVAEEPPPTEVVEAAPTDAPPVETSSVDVTDSGSVDAVVTEKPPTADVVEPTPTEAPPEVPPDHPPLVDIAPIDSMVTLEPPPADDPDVGPTDPPESDSTTWPLPDASSPIGDPVGSDASAPEPAPAPPSAHRSPADASPAVQGQARTASERAVAVVSAASRRVVDELVLPRTTEPLNPATVAGAGLAAGLVVANRGPASVAVAVEFGRVGGGWASGLVFNLWLGRQLRERRITQRQLAARSGVDHSTISRLLRQDRQPSLTTATKLVKALRRVGGEDVEPETAAYFERTPEESVFPARRVELALRADEQLDDEQVRRLMAIYLDARRTHLGSEPSRSDRARAGPGRAAGEPRR
jgi:transcriptional regulator with XRE-family HTH domain